MPPVPKGNPAAAILTDPQVPEGSRFCGNSDCSQARRAWTGRAARPHRGLLHPVRHADTRSFPSFLAATSSAGSTRCEGCIAHGGLGWIYLAIDRNVHNRWVVLKGLVNSGDADAMAAAAAEALALAEVEHPNIVRIYNFVEHNDSAAIRDRLHRHGVRRRHVAEADPQGPQRSSAARPGRRLHRRDRAGAGLSAHAEGLAYCDFKPDNVMQTDEQLKLIDLGAVIAMDDEECAIYGTVGYQAPEIAWTGPTVASDVYTVGRTLAVLVMDVPQENGRFVEQLPGPRRPCRCSPSTNRCTAPSCAPPTPIRPSDSRPW